METSNRPKILVTKKVFPEAIALLEQHAELDYVATSEGLTPEQIHAIGLKEVARIDADMKATIATTGFKGSFADFLAFLRSDPQFYARTPDELLGFSAYVAKPASGGEPCPAMISSRNRSASSIGAWA